jgi:hypothetical protein
MSFSGLAAIAASCVHGVMTRVECCGELPQRSLLAGSVRSFEQDDGPTPVDDLRDLEVGQPVTKRRKRRLMIQILG